MRVRHLEIEPARAKARDPEDLWDDPEWVAEPKLDGWRFLMHFGGGLDRVYLTGRRKSKRTGSLSEKGLCAPCLWPKDAEWRKGIQYTVLDGEIMSPTSDWRDVAGIMNVSPEDALRRIEEIGPPTFRVFDLLWSNGVDLRELSLIERRNIMQTLVADVRSPLISVVPQRTDSRRCYDEVVAQGGEGVVLKNLFAEYGDASAWVKVKKYVAVDVVITGFTDAKEGVTGKYLTQIGAACVSVYGAQGQLVEVGRVSGMTDDVRLDMSRNPERWLGTVAEINAQEFAKDRLRHPRWSRHRPDADPRAATMAKMFADLRQKGDQLDEEQEQLPLL